MMFMVALFGSLQRQPEPSVSKTLSRGAEMAVMVEHNPGLPSVIRENLKITHLEDKATVMNCDVITALKRL